jgi:hypothetical protein
MLPITELLAFASKPDHDSNGFGWTTGLAIWGALTGTIGALAAGRNVWWDRPRLSIRGEPERVGPDAHLVLTINNLGQPTSVIEVGFAACLSKRVKEPLADALGAALVSDELKGQPRLMPRGDSYIFRLALDDLPLPADTPLVPYARDARGYVTSTGGAFLRQLLDGAWTPSSPSPAYAAPLQAGVKVRRPTLAWIGLWTPHPTWWLSFPSR